MSESLDDPTSPRRRRRSGAGRSVLRRPPSSPETDVRHTQLPGPEFRWWDEHHVHDETAGSKRFDHPGVGRLTLTCESLLLADDPDLVLVVHSAPVGGDSAEALRLLGSWAARDERLRR